MKGCVSVVLPVNLRGFTPGGGGRRRRILRRRQGDAGDEVRRLGGEEHGGAGEVVGFAPAPGGGLASDALTPLAGGCAAGEVGLVPAGEDGVDVNVVGGELDCECACEAEESGLG